MQSELTKILISLTKDYAHEPTFGSEFAAGADLYACIDPDEIVEIKPNETAKISAGIKTEIPNGYVGLVFARSGLATKQGLRPANCIGVIDPDYRGEIIVALHNDTDHIQTINPRERIAQAILFSRYEIIWKETDESNETNRGAGGFGSTGI